MHLCLCVHVSVQVCACVDCMHLYIIMCSAGPEVAVLDWYGPEADQVYWQGGGGGGGRVAGLQVACEAHIQVGKVLGQPPRNFWDFRPSYTDHFSIISSL